MLAAIGKEVLPAYLRFARFLEVSYIPAGRDDPGISALPDGAKYYQFLIRQTTTTDLTADQIHQIGLDEVKSDEADMLVIAQKLGFPDLQAFRASLKTNPKLKPASADALLDAYRGYLGPMQARLPQLFGHLPKATFEVVPVPDYLENVCRRAYYQAGTTDGSRPGRLFINTYNATDRNLYEVEAIAYHEGIPGHHLQISIAQELQDVPDFRKYEDYTAYDRRLGTLRRTPRQGCRLLPGSLLRLRPPRRRHLARHPPRRRHRRPLPALDPPANGRLSSTTIPAIDETSSSVRGRSLHRMAQPGPRLQDRPAQDPRAARTRAKRHSATSSISAPSTTRSSTPAPCRSTSSTKESPPGSPPRNPQPPSCLSSMLSLAKVATGNRVESRRGALSIQELSS